MFWKISLAVVALLGFSYLAHVQVSKTELPALKAKNAELSQQIVQLQATNKELDTDKNGYAAERDKAVAELSQIKNLAKVVASTTQPVVTAGK